MLHRTRPPLQMTNQGGPVVAGRAVPSDVVALGASVAVAATEIVVIATATEIAIVIGRGGGPEVVPGVVAADAFRDHP